jgi:hypothetical protein
MCVLSPHVGAATKKEKLNVGFEAPCEYYEKGKTNPMCALSPM